MDYCLGSISVSVGWSKTHGANISDALARSWLVAVGGFGFDFVISVRRGSLNTAEGDNILYV